MGKVVTSYDLGDTWGPPRLALSQFTVEEVRRFWPQLEEMLDQLQHTWRYWTKDNIYQALMRGQLQMWGVGPPPRATLILLTSVDVYSAMKVLTVVWAAGTFDDKMIPLVDATFEDYAQLNGCDEIEVRGRLGWTAKLRPIGFRSETVTYVRKVKSNKMN